MACGRGLPGAVNPVSYCMGGTSYFNTGDGNKKKKKIKLACKMVHIINGRPINFKIKHKIVMILSVTLISMQ